MGIEGLHTIVCIAQPAARRCYTTAEPYVPIAPVTKVVGMVLADMVGVSVKVDKGE